MTDIDPQSYSQKVAELNRYAEKLVRIGNARPLRETLQEHLERLMDLERQYGAEQVCRGDMAGQSIDQLAAQAQKLRLYVQSYESDCPNWQVIRLIGDLQMMLRHAQFREADDVRDFLETAQEIHGFCAKLDLAKGTCAPYEILDSLKKRYDTVFALA